MKDKKKLPLMIVLGVLVAVCAGYVSMNMLGGKATGAAAKNPAAQAQTAAPNSGGTQMAQNVPFENATADVRASQPPVKEKRDPFAPAMNISTGESAPPPSRVALAPAEMLPPLLADIFPLPPLGAGAGGQSYEAREAIQQPAEQPFPTFVLTGVITGRTNVAILRLGESRYIVKEGQLIDGTYKVVTVSQDGVLLAHDDHSVFLKLGGDGNAS